jgi:ABC-type uncharacterized transport system permease subunit
MITWLAAQDLLPSAHIVKALAFIIVVLLAVACLFHVHTPRRPTDRGGFQ